MVKNSPANAWLAGCGFNTWVGKIPGGGSGNPLQCSYLKTSMDRGAWWATVHGQRSLVSYSPWTEEPGGLQSMHRGAWWATVHAEEPGGLQSMGPQTTE